MAEDAPDPKVLIADRGYDADAIRSDVETRGGTPVIPTKRNCKSRSQQTASSTPCATASRGGSVG
jgi:hypothetical protein